jgi:hypothetical protein
MECKLFKCCFGKKNKQKWPFLEEKKSHVHIFRQWAPFDCWKKTYFAVWPLTKFGSFLLWMIASLPTWQNWKKIPQLKHYHICQTKYSRFSNTNHTLSYLRPSIASNTNHPQQYTPYIEGTCKYPKLRTKSKVRIKTVQSKQKRVHQTCIWSSQYNWSFPGVSPTVSNLPNQHIFIGAHIFYQVLSESNPAKPSFLHDNQFRSIQIYTQIGDETGITGSNSRPKTGQWL